MDLVYYNGEHSVIFGDKHSWKDWHLVPSSAVFVPPPKARTEYLDIPGTNGKLDISDILTGYPTYECRSGSFSFVYLPEFGPTDKLYEDILNTVHGKRMKVILTDEPEYYYEGRISVKEFTRGKDYTNVTFEYTFDPFKLETHVSPKYTGIPLLAETETNVDIVIGKGPMRQCPAVTSTVQATITLHKQCNNTTSIINVVPSPTPVRYPALTLGPGLNHMLILSETNGSISFDVRRGSL